VDEKALRGRVKKRVLVCFGTRPEVIKLAPVVYALRKRPDHFDCIVCSTGQHREMVDQTLKPFGLNVDIQLDAMTRARSLGLLTSALFELMDQTFNEVDPNIVVVQGDTTSAFVSAMTAFYRRKCIAHVEAGLRTNDIFSPFPEEVNRVYISRIADYNFAPTRLSADNLLHEHVPKEKIHITGNTVVDALQYLSNNVTANVSDGVNADLHDFIGRQQIILVTSHRRENFGEGLDNICQSLLEILAKLPQAGIIFPVHLNPSVWHTVNDILGNHPRIRLLEPVDYLTMLYLMNRSYCILSDSGGIQEEAPSLRKPLLILRENTERPECLDAGCALLVGTDVRKIVGFTLRLFNDSAFYQSMAEGENPFGDGDAAGKIAELLKT
jgi:UDP-N-acetylglucosamine 2-epimerase (non-hydrolysing)